MQKMEVLAPVGGQEQLIAAVRTGADAVYLGAKGFNARRNAENFTEGGLAEAVSFCHARNVRVYVTINTLVTDDELPALVETLREVAQSGADAVIVQDLAVIALAKQHCPDIPLHASTQMTIHNAAGALRLQAMGISRVVLARELSIAEIASIHAQTNLELEVFVHGALCMCVSGACYLSSMLGGRSGNRGLCAQPCRLDFTANGRPYALSLKDLSALQHVDALAEAGVCALKIEGRMKRPEYVAAAVTATRQAIAGEPYDIQTLADAFSRGGFTDGHLTGKRGLAMFGIRDAQDVQASLRVHGKLADLYRRERASVPVRMTLSLSDGESATLTVTDSTHEVCVRGDVPQLATASPTDHDRAWRSLSKTGESPFALAELTLETDGRLMLPASALNHLRREALSQLLGLREQVTAWPFVEAPLPALPAHAAKEEPSIRIRFASVEQLWPEIQAEQIQLPTDCITPALIDEYGSRLAGELPALIFPEQEARTVKLLRSLKENGLQAVVCHNLGAIEMAREAGLTAHGGYGLNILNSLALDAYAAMGLADATVSFELHAEKIRRLAGGIPRGLLAYGLLPLMQLRTCPAQGPNGCGACRGQAILTDRMGTTFPLVCHKRQYATLLNSVPLSLSGEILRGVDFCTLFFTTETADQCRRIAEAFAAHTPSEEKRTRGLYFRTLQ